MRPLDVGFVGAEEGFHRFGGQLFGVVVVVIAEAVDVVAPEFGDEVADGFAVFEGVAVDLHLFLEYFDGVGCGGEDADAFLGGQAEAVLGGAGQVEARVGRLVRLGEDAAFGDAPVVAFVFVLVGSPDFGQHTDGFVPQAAGVAGVDAEAGLFVGVGAAGADLNAAVGELVEEGDAFGDADGVMVGEDADAVADADLFGDAAEGAEDGILGGGAGEAGEEVVFHEPEVVETNLVGQFALFQGFLVEGVPVDLRSLERALAFVEQSELHGGSPLAAGWGSG